MEIAVIFPNRIFSGEKYSQGIFSSIFFRPKSILFYCVNNNLMCIVLKSLVSTENIMIDSNQCCYNNRFDLHSIYFVHTGNPIGIEMNEITWSSFSLVIQHTPKLEIQMYSREKTLQSDQRRFWEKKWHAVTWRFLQTHFNTTMIYETGIRIISFLFPQEMLKTHKNTKRNNEKR